MIHPALARRAAARALHTLHAPALTPSASGKCRTHRSECRLCSRSSQAAPGLLPAPREARACTEMKQGGANRVLAVLATPPLRQVGQVMLTKGNTAVYRTSRYAGSFWGSASVGVSWKLSCSKRGRKRGWTDREASCTVREERMRRGSAAHQCSPTRDVGPTIWGISSENGTRRGMLVCGSSRKAAASYKNKRCVGRPPSSKKQSGHWAATVRRRSC